MKYCLPFLLLISLGCTKKIKSTTDEMSPIQRDTDILDEEDLEALPESQ